MDAKVDQLKAAVPFLSDSVIATLAKFENILEFPEGYTLCKQGSVEDTAYILLEGKVDIYKHESGEIYYLDSMTGGIFGELALLLETPRAADVVAASPVKVIEISRDEFETYSKANSAVAIELSKMMIQRMVKQVSHLIMELSNYRKSAAERPTFFFSYSHNDNEFVLALAGDLRRRGIRVWLDTYDINPGESWSRQVGSALDACDKMLLILSPDALASENVDDEWNYFLDVKKTVIPILYKPCTLPFRLHKLQYINFNNQEYLQAVNQLVAYLFPLSRAE